MAQFTNGPYQVIYFESSEKSPEDAYDPTSGRATRTIFIAWHDWVSARLAFMGHPLHVGFDPVTGLGGKIQRVLPHQYPRDLNLYASGQPKVEPVGFRGRDNPDTNGLDVSKYEWAKLTFNYSNLTYQVLTDAEVGDDEAAAIAAGNRRFVTKTVRPGGQILNYNRGFMKFVVADAPAGTPQKKIIKEGVPVFFPFKDVTYTWHQVPLTAVPYKAYQAALRSLNNAVFDNEPIGCMQLQSAEPSREMMAPDGTRIVDVQLKFRVEYRYGLYIDPVLLAVQPNPRANGHNYVPYLDTNPTSATKGQLLWALATSDGTATGTTKYPLTDYTRLFKPDQP